MGRWGESFKVCFLIDKYAMFMWISLADDYLLTIWVASSLVMTSESTI